MRPVIWVVAVGTVALGLLEAALGVAAQQSAAMYPDLAHLAPVVLALALAFCACGQLALLVGALASGRSRLVGIGATTIAMAALLLAIEFVTAAESATPAGFLVLGGGTAALLAIAGLAAFGLLTRQMMTPAARAGSA
jgi:hypothetical protein